MAVKPVQFIDDVHNHQNMGSQEIFFCHVPSCSSVLCTKAALETHVKIKHTNKTLNKNVEEEFDFGEASENVEKEFQFEDVPASKPKKKAKIEEIVKNTVKKNETLKFEPKRQTKVFSPKPSVIQSRPSISSAVPPQKSTSVKTKPRNMKLELSKFYIKSESWFTEEKVKEISKTELTEKQLEAFRNLIAEGRDQEIYIKLFGSLTEERSWICYVCDEGKFFGSSQAFEEHHVFDLKHQGKKSRYTCELCLKTLSSVNNFEYHMKSLHFRDVKCRVCDKSFTNEVKLTRHELRKHQIGGLKCDLCEKVYPNKYGLIQHKKIFHQPGSFYCSFCAKRFKTQQQLNAHEKNIHSERKEKKRSESEENPKFYNYLFTCKTCDKTFSKRDILNSHKHKVHGEIFMGRKLNCEDCGKIFLTKNNLSKHRRFHHEKHPSLMCKSCDKILSSTHGMRQHMKNIHDRIKNYSCSLCSSQFFAKDKLRKHESKVHQKTLEECRLCQRTIKHAYHHVIANHKDIPNAWQKHKELEKAASGRQKKIVTLINEAMKEVLNDETKES